jgi:porin
VGRVDPTDYFDMYALNSSQSHFLNKAFGTHPTVDSPSFGYGAAVGAMLSDNVYGITGFSDAIGSATQSRWSEIRDDKEFFHHAEIGWTPSKERVARDNVHLGYWKTDSRDDTGEPSNWGLTASASMEDENGFIPFVRAGFADGDTTTMDRVLTFGAGQRFFGHDLLGVGFSWGRPEDRSLDDQYTAEVFYNIELGSNINLTPDLQLIKDPALDPDNSTLWIFGVRLRITF